MDTDDPILKRLPRGVRPWAVLTGGVLSMVTFGIVYTCGNLLPYLVSYFRWKLYPDMRTGQLIWLQTLLSGLPMGMVIGGLVERNFGGRAGAILGSIIYTIGVGSTFYSIQHSYGATLVTMGVVASVGSSIAYSSILPTAQRWLPDNVGLAGGVIIGGYGCGAFILAPLQTAFINPLDYRVNADGFFTQEDLLERVPYVFIVMAIFFTVFQSIGLIFIGQPDESIHVETENLIGTNSEIRVEQARVWPQLRTTTFLVLFLSLTCNATWVQLTSGLYKAYGQQFIDSDFFLSLIGSFSSIFNAGSRVFWGAVADTTSYQFSMSIVCSLGAILAFSMPFVKLVSSDMLYLATVCLIFSCIGGTFSIFPYITHKCFSKANFSVMYGYLQCAVSLAGLFAGLISTHALPVIGFENLFLVCGLFMVLSLGLTFIVHKTDLARLMLSAQREHYEEEEEGEAYNSI
uniref:Major facilitator superfamily (MFS) profile domain-containing protein n=1 Tax=Caenorhabditis japonica TaxID=281687 RepID=A0A8R1HYM3_CAEJA